jgi:uncharacterized membrane protein
MHMTLASTHHLLAAVLLAITSSAALGEATYVNTGTGIIWYGVSADGSVAAGSNSNFYLVYTATSGVRAAATRNWSSANTGVSWDGRYIAGGVQNSSASNRWQMARGDRNNETWTACGDLGISMSGEGSSASGISGDGSTVFGLAWTTGGNALACTWRQGTGIQSLGTSVPNRSTRANGSNVDGTVIVGWQDGLTGFRQGCIWNNGVQTLLFFANGEPAPEALACSADGSVVVGLGNESNSFHAWRWTAQTGIVDILPREDWADWEFMSGAATGVSADGNTIVGYYRFGGTPYDGHGWIWTPSKGVQDLTTLALDQGANIPSLQIAALPLAISADGRTVVGGSGNAETTLPTGGFVLRLESPCFGDVDGSGIVDSGDVALTLLDYGPCPGCSSDLDETGEVDFGDVALVLLSTGPCD